MAEIWKSDDAGLSDAEHLADDMVRFHDDLQGLVEYDIVVGVVGIVHQPLVEVALGDRQAAFDALDDVSLVDIDAAAGDFFPFHEFGEQRAVTTPEIEHMGILRDDLAQNLAVSAVER